MVSPGLGELRRKTRARSNLRPIVVGQAVSLFGDYIAYVALPLFIVQLTGSALDLGLTAASETIPLLLFGIGGGVFLDRHNTKATMIVADLVRAAAFVLLAAAAFVEVATPLTVFATAFVVGSMSSLFDSGLQAYLPRALGDSLLVEANARLQLVRTLAWTTGSAMGGLIIEFAGPGPAFLVNAGTFLVSAIYLSLVVEVVPRPPVEREPLRRAFTAGLRYVWDEPRLRWATLGALVANFTFAPLEVTLALFGTTRLGLSEAGVGWLYALQALIGAGGAYFAPALTRRLRLGRLFVIGMMLMGGGFLVVARSSNFLAVVPVGIALVGVSWTNVAFATLRQRLTPPPLLGRVVAASRTLGLGGIPLGAALGGLVGQRIGLVPLFTLGALLVVATGLALATTPLWRSSDGD